MKIDCAVTLEKEAVRNGCQNTMNLDSNINWHENTSYNMNYIILCSNSTEKCLGHGIYY